MKKKIIGILVMMLLIGIAIIPSVSGLKLSNINDDQVDQQQTENQVIHGAWLSLLNQLYLF